MKTAALYNDAWHGPRWRYGLRYRPAGIGTVPVGGWIPDAPSETSRTFPHGTVDYARELTADEVASYQLAVLGRADR